MALNFNRLSGSLVIDQNVQNVINFKILHKTFSILVRGAVYPLMANARIAWMLKFIMSFLSFSDNLLRDSCIIIFFQ